MNKTEQIENFKIIYKKYLLSKNIRLTVKSEDKILVTLPFFCPYKKAREFVFENIEKIKKVQIKRKIFDKNFKTKFDILKIIPSENTKTITKNEIVYFYYDEKFDFSDKLIQKEFREALFKALRIEAKKYLPQRLELLAQKCGYKYNKLSLRNQKTRFGSCSYQNNINLNINLMRFDFDVIDYVLIHELAHTKIKNHSKTFWQEVEKHCPNYKILRKKLKTT